MAATCCAISAARSHSFASMGAFDRQAFFASLGYDIDTEPPEALPLDALVIDHPRGGDVVITTAWALWYAGTVRDGAALPSISQWSAGDTQRRQAEALAHWLVSLGLVEHEPGRPFIVRDADGVRQAIDGASQRVAT